MRIIHCAPFNSITKVGGALYANPVKISLGLSENGHFVHNFDYRDIARYFSIFHNKKNGTSKMNAHFLQVVEQIKPDLIIFGHAELVLRQTIEKIKQKNIRLSFWFNDVPLGKEYHEIVSLCEALFVTAGGTFIDNLKHINSNINFLPNPVHEGIECYKAFEIKNFKHDVLFSARANNERKVTLERLKLTSSINLTYIGDTKENTIIGDEYFQKIISSKICLNHNRDFTLPYKWYTSDRLSHILGNGSFALSRRIMNGEDFFEDKLDYYDSDDEMIEKISFYLQDEKLMFKNAKWLHERIHNIFNAKRIGKYIIDAILQRDLKEYEWSQK